MSNVTLETENAAPVKVEATKKTAKRKTGKESQGGQEGRAREEKR